MEEPHRHEVREQRILLRALAIPFLMVMAVMGAAGAALYAYRGEVVRFLASEYVHERFPSGAPAAGEEGGAAGAGFLGATEEQIVSIVDRTNPAVVSVIVTQDVPVFEQFYEEYDPFGGLFGDQFKFRIPRRRPHGTEEKEVGAGSGFFVSSDGLVVTNRHVVDIPGAKFTILTEDGEEYGVKILAKDSVLDIAVLKVEDAKGRTFPFLSFSDSDSLKLGQTAIAIGNALGEFRNSVSVGVVSGLSRSIVAGGLGGAPELLDDVIQTDAAINPGNSGGPLLDSRGRVIGVNVAVAMGSENVGFAIPANVVKDIVASVQQFGEIKHPFLGVRYTMVNKSVAQAEDLPVEYGALIARGKTPMDIAILPGSPADKAGLKEGDIIIAVDGVSLKEKSLAAVIRTKKIGQTITLTVIRDGKELTLTATLEAAPE